MSERTSEYFEKVSSQWDEMRKDFYGEEVRDAVVTASRIGPSDTVLDVGAGTGFLTEAAAKIARNVIALDLSRSMTDKAIGKLSGRNVEFKLGSAESIPLPDSSVDVVIGNMILHHCMNPERAIIEIARVLRPNGRMALSDLQEHHNESFRTDHADVWLGFKMESVKKMMDDAGIQDSLVQELGSCCSTTAKEGRVEIPMFLAYGRKLGFGLMMLSDSG